MPPFAGTCTTSTGSNTSTTADEGIVRGWRSIHVTDGDQPYMDKWWVPGLGIGYEHSFIHQVADFLRSLETGEPCSPTFQDALETQKVCEAVIDSANARSWRDTGVESFAGFQSLIFSFLPFAQLPALPVRGWQLLIQPVGVSFAP